MREESPLYPFFLSCSYRLRHECRMEFNVRIANPGTCFVVSPCRLSDYVDVMSSLRDTHAVVAMQCDVSDVGIVRVLIWGLRNLF